MHLFTDPIVLEKFCFALHNMENLPGKPEGFEGELFRLLFDSAEIAKFTAQEKIKYEYDMTTERDIRNQIAYAHDKGIEKGIEQGIQSERSRIEEKLRKKGMSDEEIAKLLEN
jgi:uncharacterized protein (DUF433 family)